MSFWETIRGVFGELMLFLTAAFLTVALAAVYLAFVGDPEKYIAIGTPFVVAAGAMYTARGYLEQCQWKKLSITALIVVIAVTMSGTGTTTVTGETVWEAAKGFFGVSIAAIMTTFAAYIVRTIYLINMYFNKRTIVKSVRSGNFQQAMQVAKGRRAGLVGTNYLKAPGKLSNTVALALLCALEKLGETEDAKPLRDVIASRKCHLRVRRRVD